MGKSDESLTFAPFRDFLAGYTTEIDRFLETSQPFALISSYGMGKDIIYTYLKSLPVSKYQVTLIDLSLFTELTAEKFYTVILQTLKLKFAGSSDDFYLQLSEYLDQLKSTKLVIVFRHACKLSALCEADLNNFNNFCYRNREKLGVIGSASPQLLNFPVEPLKALFKNNFLYVSKLDTRSALNDVRLQAMLLKTDLSKYEADIVKLSQGVHGTITFLSAILAREKPEELNDRFIYQSVYTHPNLKGFFDECLGALTAEQIELIQQYCLLGQIRKADQEKPAFKQLVKYSIFYKSGKSYRFIYDLFAGYILHHLERLPATEVVADQYDYIIFALSKCKFLTYEELKLLELLAEKKGEVANFDDITTRVWNDPQKYSPAALNKLVSRIRLALVKHPGWKCTIMTKYKLGYYLVC